MTSKEKFLPDWDKLEAARDSLREHMLMLKARDEKINALEAEVERLNVIITEAARMVEAESYGGAHAYLQTALAETADQQDGWRSTEAEINLCARDLPEGAEVGLHVENGAAWVSAENWRGCWEDGGYPDHSLAERIAIARQWCIDSESSPPADTEGA